MDPATLAALDRNYLDASRLFMVCSDRGEYVERRDVAIVCCGVPADELNIGFLKPPFESLDATAEAVSDHFRGHRLRFRLMLRDDGDRRWSETLEKGGWLRRRDVTPGMARGVPDTIPALPPELEIEEVRTPEALVDYRETAFLGFGYPVAAARLFLTERMLALPELRMYAGRVGGRVVATSMLVVSGRVGGIYWVATLEDQRGRGYGEALTWAACEGARAFGCDVASLQASQMGRPVYARMGFETVIDYVSFVREPAS